MDTGGQMDHSSNRPRRRRRWRRRQASRSCRAVPRRRRGGRKLRRGKACDRAHSAGTCPRPCRRTRREPMLAAAGEEEDWQRILGDNAMPLFRTREMGSLGTWLQVSPHAPAARSSTTKSSSRSPTRCGFGRARPSSTKRRACGRSSPRTARPFRSSRPRTQLFRFLRDGSTVSSAMVATVEEYPQLPRSSVPPLETRIGRMMDRLQTDNRGDRGVRDPDERGSPHGHHQAPLRRELRDPELYDLVLCTERLSVE